MRDNLYSSKRSIENGSNLQGFHPDLQHKAWLLPKLHLYCIRIVYYQTRTKLNILPQKSHKENHPERRNIRREIMYSPSTFPVSPFAWKGTDFSIRKKRKNVFIFFEKKSGLLEIPVDTITRDPHQDPLYRTDRGCEKWF